MSYELTEKDREELDKLSEGEIVNMLMVMAADGLETDMFEQYLKETYYGMRAEGSEPARRPKLKLVVDNVEG